MDFSVDRNINFFDTAELYAVPPKKETYTKTETMIGNWFSARKNRDKIILATKVAGPGPSWIRGGNKLTQNIEAILLIVDLRKKIEIL